MKICPKYLAVGRCTVRVNLHPDEYVWAHTKYARLCNYAAPGLDELRREVGKELEALQKDKDLLRSFIEHSKLKLLK